MGYKLYREVMDLMPWDWTPGERLVALVIADSAGEKSRVTTALSQPVLCKRTGYTPDGLKRVFQRLASRGFEFRISHGTGKDGREVFSARGHATDYQVPDLVEALKTPRSKPVDKPRKAGQASLLPELEGGTPVPEGGTPVPEGGTQGPDRRYAGTAPFPQFPQVPLNISSSKELDAVNGNVEERQPMRGQDRLMSVIEAEAWAAVTERAASR